MNKGQELEGYQVLTDSEAKLLNENPTLTGFKYELIEEETAFDKLKKEAKELGINFAKNITEEKLQEKVNEAKKQNND